MAKYQLFHPDTEIVGQIILDFTDAIGSERFSPILAKHGLTNVQPDKWYPAQPWVDVLNEVVDAGSSFFDFVSLGIKQIESAALPPEFEALSLEEKIRFSNQMYVANYRGTDIGEVKVEVVSKTHFKIIVRAFEPDNLWYGNAHGFMRRFAPKDVHYVVYFDKNAPRREEGGEVTIIHIEW